MKETYVSITITNYGMNDPMNYARIYIDTGKLVLHHRLSFEDGCREMARLAKALGKAPQLVTNWYNRGISYRELRGLIE